MISIIIPSYNRALFIEETLQSIINQTSDNWECLVVDDGSTDNSVEIIAAYIKKDPRFKLFFRDREPKGASTCRNIGVAKSSGDYLLFLDTDDILEAFCIEQRLNAMREDLDFAIFPALMFKNKPYDLNLWWNIDKPETELIRQFKHDAICQGTGALWKKESFVKMGMWNENLSIWQDIDLFFIAYIGGYKYQKFFQLKPDLHIRLYESSISRSDYFSPDKLRSRENVIKNVFNLLITNAKYEYMPYLGTMAFEVASGYFRSKHFKEGNLFLKWLSKNKLFKIKEIFHLSIIRYIFKFHLSGFKFAKFIMKQVNKNYHHESGIAKIKYQI